MLFFRGRVTNNFLFYTAKWATNYCMRQLHLQTNITYLHYGLNSSSNTNFTICVLCFDVVILMINLS